MASALLASRAEPLWGERKVYARKNSNPNPNSKTNNHNPNPNSNSNSNPNSIKQINHHGRQMDEVESVSVTVSDDSSSFNRINSKLVKETNNGGFVTFNIAAYTKKELKDLKKRLALELEEVQKLRRKIESAGFQLDSGYRAPASVNHFSDGGNRKLMPKAKPGKKQFGNKRGAGVVPFDSMRDLKRAALEGPEAAMMEQCGKILEKLMGSKFGWVFNIPVDAVGMGLHDYHQIVRHPMDLGTVKTKLGQNLYALPEDFASDVRLTFNNALTYNPKGHDVFVMAKKLLTQFEKFYGTASKKFEEQRRSFAAMAAAQETNWGVERERERYRSIAMPADETKWGRESVSYDDRRQVISSSTTPEPVRRHDPIQSPVPALRPHSPSVPMQAQPSSAQSVQATKQLGERPRSGKLPKPKARDLHKREMTFEEKQQLSLNLQDLPQEKMDTVVQIMRRRNATLSQSDDEIEVDIENLDKETLWELDRFVDNYRKMMGKLKRQEELEQNRNPGSSEGNKSPVSETTEAVPASEKARKVEVEEDIDIGEDIPTTNFPPVEIDKDVGQASSTSSSSSSDSSSSSGSDSGSSSDSDSDGDDRDEAQSPGTHLKAPASPNSSIVFCFLWVQSSSVVELLECYGMGGMVDG